MVEVVVAVALLVVAMGGVYRLLTASMASRQVARDYYVGVVLANNRIERAKSLSFDNLALLAENEQPVDDLGMPDMQGRFLRSTVVEREWGGEPGLTRIMVTVHWPPPRHYSGDDRPSVFVSTLLTTYLDP